MRGSRRNAAPCIAGLSAVLAFAASGCGGASTNPLQDVVDAAKLTLSRTAASSTTLAGAQVFGARGLSAPVRGEFAFPTGLGYAAVDLRDASDPQAGKVFLFFDGARLLLAPHAAILPAGKVWLSADLSREPAAAPTPFVVQVEGLNPQLLLGEIAWGARAAVHVGNPVLDHVPFREYTVSLDLRRALAAATGAHAPALRAAIRAQLAALGSRKATVTVWLDGPGRVAKLRAVVAGSGLGTMTIDLSDFGTTVPRSLPTAATTVDVASVRLPRGGSSSPWFARY